MRTLIHLPEYRIDLGYVQVKNIEISRAVLLLTATTDARYKRPNIVATMTVKIVALTGVPVLVQIFAKKRRSGNAF